MTCRELVASFGELVDGGLSGFDDRAAGRHLVRCDACRAYAGSYRTVIALCREAFGDDEVADLPEDLVAAILAARCLRPTPTVFA